MKQYFFTGLFIALCLTVSAQGIQLPSADDSLLSQLPGKYLNSVQNKTKRVENLVARSGLKALRKMEKLENELKTKLQKADPSRVESLWSISTNRASNMKDKLLSKSKERVSRGGYLDNYTDTLQSILDFLDNQRLKGIISSNELEKAKQNLLNVKDQLNISSQIQEQIRERKQQLSKELAGIANCRHILSDMNRQAVYYTQRLNEYRDILYDPSKAEKKAMELLRKNKMFQTFMQKNSMLSGLFNINMSEDPTQALQNLQGRSVVEQQIQQSIGSDPSAQQTVSQQMDQSVSVIDQAKQKVSSGAGSVDDMPDFQPNPLKTKRFLQRLEYGGNVQSQRSTTLLPTMTDIALEVAYKFSPKTQAGFGLVYKVGWGKSLSHITLTTEGIGFRSFANYRLKGRLHATAGIEYNKFMRINSMTELKKWTGWSRSSLAGIKVMVSDKAGMLLLYDFEAQRSIPQTNSLKIRYHYKF